MAIFDLFEHVEKKTQQQEIATPEVDLHHFSEFRLAQEQKEETPATRSRIFSSLAARLFFSMLLVADIFWGFYSIIKLMIALPLNLVCGFKSPRLKKFFLKTWLNIKRSFVCGISLFVAIISPALGTMFACTYFLMYDKAGIDEVVPSVLQDQFREFFN